MKNLITILGPTACGKTAVATRLAARFFQRGTGAEIISADSRQVFRGMDIGTGKDLADYDIPLPCIPAPTPNASLSEATPSSATSSAPSAFSAASPAAAAAVPGGSPSGPPSLLHIPHHLIDIAQPGTKYSVFEFQRDFLDAYDKICSRARMPILCGGTGLYIESVLRAYKLVEVPVNPELRQRLEGKSLEELTTLLATYKRLHNTTDVDTARRAIRAIEIEEYYRQNRIEDTQPFPNLASLTIGLNVPRDLRRQRITARLQRRLQEEDMTGEVRRLLDHGVPAEALISYGLEYRYITLHLLGQLSFEEMARQLEIAIHQFAKRQMTYFRGMERRGVSIHWIDATRPPEDIADEIFQLFLASFEENL